MKGRDVHEADTSPTSPAPSQRRGGAVSGGLDRGSVNDFGVASVTVDVSLEEALEKAVAEDVERRDASCAACGCRNLEADVWGVGEGLNGAEARAAVECTDCGARLNVRVTEELLKEAREEADAS